MNRPFYRPPTVSRASPTTLCQKCLKKDIYECKAPPQERPYAARPSRSQQLLNPKLAPKLSSDVPNDLLRRKGVADETLAHNQAERGRKRSVEGSPSGPRKASRSISTSSSTSVSTISTSASRSPSPRRRDAQSPADRLMMSQYDDERPPRDEDHIRKRRRRSVSSSQHSRDDRDDPDRNTRRRRRSFSPEQRGRRRSREREPLNDRSRSRSYSRGHGQNGDKSYGHGRAGRRKSPSRSPYRPLREHENGHGAGRQPHATPRAPPKERSLSPFSKRLALTQAMNTGR